VHVALRRNEETGGYLPFRWTERYAQQVLAQYFDWFQNLVVPNVYEKHYGREADIFVLRKSGYLVEVEIKLTAADWQRDGTKKSVVTRGRSMPISRLYYAVPENLIDSPPAWFGETTGLLVLHSREGKGHVRLSCEERRPAALLTKDKARPEDVTQLLRAAYYRFWRARERCLKEHTGHRGKA
jgi:hypothetical protein